MAARCASGGVETGRGTRRTRADPADLLHHLAEVEREGSGADRDRRGQHPRRRGDRRRPRPTGSRSGSSKEAHHTAVRPPVDRCGSYIFEFAGRRRACGPSTACCDFGCGALRLGELGDPVPRRRQLLRRSSSHLDLTRGRGDVRDPAARGSKSQAPAAPLERRLRVLPLRDRVRRDRRLLQLVRRCRTPRELPTAIRALRGVARPRRPPAHRTEARGHSRRSRTPSGVWALVRGDVVQVCDLLVGHEDNFRSSNVWFEFVRE